MSNVLSEEKRQQVIALGRLGWPLRRIEQETGVRRETAGSYLKAAGIAVRPPGAWGRRPPAKPANEVTTGFGAERSVSDAENPKPIPSTSFCEPFRDAIQMGLSRGRTAMAIWQDLMSEHGFRGGYQTVKRFVRKLRGNQLPQPRAVIVTAPGEEAQVDYGRGPMTRDPQSGKYRRTRLFVMTLGCSRKAARFLTFRSSSRIWAELHEKAFRRFGGSTRMVVLDNLREGVLVPDIYDPALNPLYRDVLAHYGAVALPCRIKDPIAKAKSSPASATPSEHSRESALRVWKKPGTGKSHLAQAIGQAAIQQGYRVLYRETHKLLDDLAEATIDGTRKEHMELLASVPLLIIDDLGMRKLPVTVAEELLEIVMRRYERASTLLTSNRPVEDWGKLLGDSAAVTAMLDRLLHHGHVLKCGPRSWRTKTDLPAQEAVG